MYLIGFPEYWNPDPVDWKNLRDNRDFRTISSFCEDDTEKEEEIIQNNFKGEVEYVKLRHILLRGIVAALYTSDDVIKQFDDSTGEKAVERSLAEILKEVEEQEEVCKQFLDSEIIQNTPHSPYRYRRVVRKRT